jgi:hypothetical protein
MGALQKGENSGRMLFCEPSHRMIGLPVETHRQLAPGLPKALHERRLCYERQGNDRKFSSQVARPVYHNGKGTS